MKILILGATGNLGRLTAAALTEHYPQVQLRLTSHREAGRDVLRQLFPRAEVFDADWSDESSLRGAISGVDKLLMVTPDFTTDEAVVTPNLIRAVKAVGGVSLILRFIAIPPGLTVADFTPEQLATRCGAALHTVAKPLLDASGLPVTYVNAACWIMFNLPWFLAEDVKARRHLTMPAAADAARQWVSEYDIADVFAKVLVDEVSLHAGREYLISTGPRFTFPQVAELLGSVLGEKVTYVDDDSGLRSAYGDTLPVLMTYFTHETVAYTKVPATDTIERLLARPPVGLRQYIERNKSLFQ